MIESKKVEGGSEDFTHELLAARSDAAVVADIVKDHIKATLVDVDEPNTVLVLPRGMTAHSVKAFVDEYRTEPERRKGIARLGDLGSFVDHAKRFADADSVLYANPDPVAPTLTSVLDYHRAGATKAPRFGEHRGIYAFPLSDEWKAWKASNGPGNAMSQASFAEFIENRITDLADPATAGDSARELFEATGASFASPSKLLDLSRGLSVRVGAKVQNAVNLASGEASMQFVAQHNDESGAALKVPGAFLVTLPVFRFGALYQLAVRLRYRVRDGAVTWFYELWRADRVFDHAFKEACALAKSETGLPLYVGSPE